MNAYMPTASLVAILVATVVSGCAPHAPAAVPQPCRGTIVAFAIDASQFDDPLERSARGDTN